MDEANLGQETTMTIIKMSHGSKDTGKSLGSSAVQEKAQRFTIPIIDARENPDERQLQRLRNRLETEQLDVQLQKLYKVIGRYAARQPTDLAIKLVKGGTMGGQVAINIDSPGRLIDFSLPTEGQLEQMRQMPHPKYGVLSSASFQEIMFAVAASTIKHEASHGILDSTPTSQLAKDLQRITGIENTDGEVAALLDEGIAYAFQGLEAASIDPIGSLAPIVNDTDDFTERTRKQLGEGLRPLLMKYIAEGKQLDEVFLTVAGKELSEIDLNHYIEVSKMKKLKRTSSHA